MELTKLEIEQFSRHLVLDEIGIKGQLKLKKSKVLVIGAGGLGCPVLQYLSAAGVGNIGIVDNDKVDISNLQRQILFDHSSIGKFKTEEAKNKLQKVNPAANISLFTELFTSVNALDIISNFDFIVDCTDNYSARYLIDDACVILDKVLIYGAIYKFEGHVSVFNYKNGPSYRCLYPTPPKNASLTNCSKSGVVGVLPGIIGTLQANEIIKLITEIGEVISGKLLVFNALKTEFNMYKLSPKLFPIGQRSKNIQVASKSESQIKSINIEQFITLKKKDVQIIDVRSKNNLSDILSFKSIHIPHDEILEQYNQIDKEKTIIIICQYGKTSKKVIELLQEKYNLHNLYNLEGGINTYLQQTD